MPASVSSSSAPWSPTTDLAQGMFITASRSLLDPNFSHTVVLLLEYDAEGALGLIVNRPTDIDLASLLPDSKWLEGRAEPVFIGGPVSRDHLVVLMRSGAAPPPDESGQVLSDTYVTGSLASLEKFLTTEVAGAEFRVFAGYAGWARGQLDSEVMRGDWHVSPADSQTVFELPPARVWPALIRRNSGQWVHLAPGDGEDQASR